MVASIMAEPQAIEKLTSLGMNGREARLYVALLQTAEATPAILHQISGVPRTKTYETLDGMVASGFCSERQEGRRKFFRATPPDEVCALLRKQWDQDHQRRCRIADEAFAQLTSMFQSSRNADPALERIEVIRSRDQINLNFMMLMQDCRREVLSFTRSPYAAVDEEIRTNVKRVQREAMDRGVAIKTVYMVENQDWTWLHGFVTELEQAGEQVRITDTLPIKMFVFDRKTVLIALPSVPGLTGADFTMLAVQDDGFTSACHVLFETYWERGRTWREWTDGRQTAAESAG